MPAIFEAPRDESARGAPPAGVKRTCSAALTQSGTRMWPHKHPEDRIYAVLSGVFYFGLGEELDESNLTAHGPGAVLVLPCNQPHIH